MGPMNITEHRYVTVKKKKRLVTFKIVLLLKKIISQLVIKRNVFNMTKRPGTTASTLLEDDARTEFIQGTSFSGH